MTFSDNSPQEKTLTTIAYRILGGAVLGLILVIICLIYDVFLTLSGINWSTTNVTILASVPIVCGLLSAVFGKRFWYMLLATIANLLGVKPYIKSDESK